MAKGQIKDSGQPPREPQTAVGTPPAPAPSDPPPPGTETPPAAGAMTQIAEALAASMPEPSPEAIAAVRNEKSPDDPPADPVAGNTGPIKRGRGRPPGSGAKKSTVTMPGKSGAANAAISQQIEDTAAKQLAATKLAAGTMTQLTIMLGVMIGGEDFKPGHNEMVGEKDDVFLKEAYFEYCRAKGVVDLPPGIALTAALCVYVMPRLNKPETQNRVKSLGAKIVGWFKGFRKKKNGSHVVGGNDGERQDHPKPAIVSGI